MILKFKWQCSKLIGPWEILMNNHQWEPISSENNIIGNAWDSSHKLSLKIKHLGANKLNEVAIYKIWNVLQEKDGYFTMGHQPQVKAFSKSIFTTAIRVCTPEYPHLAQTEKPTLTLSLWLQDTNTKGPLIRPSWVLRAHPTRGAQCLVPGGLWGPTRPGILCNGGPPCGV